MEKTLLKNALHDQELNSVSYNIYERHLGLWITFRFNSININNKRLLPRNGKVTHSTHTCIQAYMFERTEKGTNGTF